MNSLDEGRTLQQHATAAITTNIPTVEPPTQKIPLVRSGNMRARQPASIISVMKLLSGQQDRNQQPVIYCMLAVTNNKECLSIEKTFAVPEAKRALWSWSGRASRSVEMAHRVNLSSGRLHAHFHRFNGMLLSPRVALLLGGRSYSTFYPLTRN